MDCSFDLHALIQRKFGDYIIRIIFRTAVVDSPRWGHNQKERTIPPSDLPVISVIPVLTILTCNNSLPFSL
jgi:hypothetical protein